MVFHHAADLRQFYPRWVNHAMTTFSSPDVMRFLGKHINSNGQLHQDFSGEVVSDFKRRAEGVRVKHSVNGNSVKLYDKAYTPKGSVLRAEATIHNADDFRVYRRKEGDRKGPRAWRRLRRGIADIYRRAQLSHKAAARYLDAFATVDDTTTLDQLLQRLEQPRQWRGRRVRALRPLADDRALLSAINHGEFAIHGFRNRDLRAIFFRQTTDDKQQRRRHSAWISRKLPLLRSRPDHQNRGHTSLPANLQRSQDHRGYPKCVTLHSCAAHACDSPTNRSRCVDTLKIFANEKDFGS